MVSTKSQAHTHMLTLTQEWYSLLCGTIKMNEELWPHTNYQLPAAANLKTEGMKFVLLNCFSELTVPLTLQLSVLGVGWFSEYIGDIISTLR